MTSLFYEEDLARHKAAVAAWSKRMTDHGLKSTMGAPLNDMETARILNAWDLLREACFALGPPSTDPVEMLDIAVDLISRIHELRRAIYDGWHGANARAFPGPQAARRREAKTITTNALKDLDKLGITRDDIVSALKDLGLK